MAKTGSKNGHTKRPDFAITTTSTEHTMSTAIKPATAAAENTVLSVAQQPGDDIFNAVANSGKYLPRLQMFGSKSGPVAEGKVPGPANYALVTGKDNYTPLGDNVACVPVAWRPKAMDVGGEEVISVHDHTDAEFKRIQEQSEVKDSGCMFGPEFLVWLPSLKKFATLFMSSKTARREAPAIRERLGKPTTLAIEFIKTKKYSWHGIVCKPCSTPFDLPDEDTVDEETEKFLNPPKVEIERAPDDSDRVR